jgi:hypothetical protein
MRLLAIARADEAIPGVNISHRLLSWAAATSWTSRVVPVQASISRKATMEGPYPTIAVVGGTGAEGSAIALRLGHAGYRVIIGTRDVAKVSA